VVAISRSGTTTEVVDLLHRLGASRTLGLVGMAPGPVEAAAAQTLALGFADEKSVVQTRFATSVIALFRALSGDDVDLLADQAAGVLGQPAVGFAGVHRFVFLGTGSGAGLAHEAALKMREAAQTVTESYPAMEYRHGPISVAGSRSLVWGLGEVEDDVLRDVERTGATVVRGDLDPMAELVKVQRMAVALAEMKGLDPDQPRHLTRSVVLS
jgi:fructoselysine-6-P-deglycase FrlB-like protein